MGNFELGENFRAKFDWSIQIDWLFDENKSVTNKIDHKKVNRKHKIEIKFLHISSSLAFRK